LDQSGTPSPGRVAVRRSDKSLGVPTSYLLTKNK
jgi:hypothetical protein